MYFYDIHLLFDKTWIASWSTSFQQSTLPFSAALILQVKTNKPKGLKLEKQSDSWEAMLKFELPNVENEQINCYITRPKDLYAKWHQKFVSFCVNTIGYLKFNPHFCVS